MENIFFQFAFRELYLFSSSIHFFSLLVILVEFLYVYLFKRFILLFLSMYICDIGIYMCVSMFQYVHLSAGARRGQRHWFSWRWIYRRLWSTWPWCWEWHVGPLQVQYTLSISEPSPQHLVFIWIWVWLTLGPWVTPACSFLTFLCYRILQAYLLFFPLLLNIPLEIFLKSVLWSSLVWSHIVPLEVFSH